MAITDLRQSIDLGRLKNVLGFLYDRMIYRCAYHKDESVKGKVLIFPSGKMISVGTKSLKDAKHDLKETIRRLASLHLIRSARPKVRLLNIVAVSDVGTRLDLELLSRKLHGLIYEPEQFPGALYWAPKLDKAAILIFSSGRIVIAGLRSLILLREAEKLLEGLFLNQVIE